MANFCGKLVSGLALDCNSTLLKRYAQEIVIINKADIATVTKTITNTAGSIPAAYSYNVAFTLKEDAKGYKITLPENGSGVFGTVEKSTSDLGLIQYNHIVNFMIFGADENTKGVLSNLDKGRYVVAMKIGDIVEVYGIDNGVSTGDYTLDIQSGNGASALTLTSGELFTEGNLPMVYKPASPGNAVADFDSAFEA